MTAALLWVIEITMVPTASYSFAAGRAPAPVGTQTFADNGTGCIAGHVFLDANGNGRRDPGEGGVHDAVVVLDGRPAARTDTAGY